jgi:hypothetical protein
MGETMRIVQVTLLAAVVLTLLVYLMGCASTRTMVLHEGDSVTITKDGIWEYTPKVGSEQEKIDGQMFLWNINHE